MQRILNLGRAVVPRRNDALVLHILGDEAAVILALDRVDLLVGRRNELRLLGRDHRVVNSNGDRAARRIFKALRLDAVEHLGRLGGAIRADAAVDNLSKFLLAHQKPDFKIEHMRGIVAVDVSQILRDGVVEDDASDRCVDDMRDALVSDLTRDAHLDRRVQADHARLIGHCGFVEVTEHLAGARLLLAQHRQIIRTENHVLRRNGNRFAVGRFEQVIRSQHQKARLGLRLCGQRDVHGHLVAVEVGVIGGEDERVELERAALD